MSRVTVKTWLDRIAGIGLLLYPFVAHFCLYFHFPEYAVAYLAGLFCLYLLNSADARNRLLRVLFACLLPLGMWWWSRYFAMRDWLYLPPVLMPMWVSLLFLGSLRQPRLDIISKIATLVEAMPLEPAHQKYTRRVTLVWGVVLAGMALEAILLAWIAPVDVWSWWVHIGNYVILLMLLLVEIPFRWWYLGKPPQILRTCIVMLKRPWIDTGK